MEKEKMSDKLFHRLEQLITHYEKLLRHVEDFKGSGSESDWDEYLAEEMDTDDWLSRVIDAGKECGYDFMD